MNRHASEKAVAVAPAVAAEPAAEREAFEALVTPESRKHISPATRESWWDWFHAGWQAARAAAPVPAGVRERATNLMARIKHLAYDGSDMPMLRACVLSLDSEFAALLAPQRADLITADEIATEVSQGRDPMRADQQEKG